MTGEPSPAVRALSARTLDVVPGDRPARRVRADAPAAQSPFQLSDNRFEPRGELGRGGMGRVEDAFDRALGRRVAIKHVLRASWSDLARFGREAQLTARLEHPGVVPIHDVGCGPDGMPYYVMRRIDGRPMSALIDGATAAARFELVPNVLAACDAVAFAHARGIVHRDLKPGNILVGRFGETLVIDWGLAQEVDPDPSASDGAAPIAEATSNASGVIPGTPGYLAPEQARGEPVDRRADVFALGATLFFVLAGCSPHQHASPTEMVTLASAGKPPDWRALPAGVPPELRAILVKALAIDPALRYADAGELAADLRRFVTGNLVGAHRYGVPARLARFVRRHRALVAAGVMSMLALTVVSLVSLRTIVAERDDATAARVRAEARERDARDASDRLLIAHAQEVANTDPVGAIALLRRLDASSSRWREAWLAAVAAWAHGIPFGFRGDHKVLWLQIAADDRHAVTASSSGDVVVYDLAARTRRSVANVPEVTMCHWIGVRRLVCRDRALRLVIVDTERGTQRVLELRANQIYSDRRSRAVVETADHEVVEIAGPEGKSRLLATGAELAGASRDLESVALRRGTRLDLWTPTRTLPMRGLARGASIPSGVEIRDHAVVGLVGDHIVRWRVQGDRLVVDRRWPRHGAIQAAMVGQHVYGLGSGQLYVDGIPLHGGLEPARLHPTANGIAMVETSGWVTVIERGGWIRFGPYPGRLERVDVSRDGRFAVAVSDSDEIVAWDLREHRGRTSRLEAHDEPVLLTRDQVWTRRSPLGLIRHGLDGDTGELLLPDVELGPPGWWLGIEENGRWAGRRTHEGGDIKVYDAVRDVRRVIRNVVAQAVDGDRLIYALSDGELRMWRSGTDLSRAIARLPSAPRALWTGGRFVVALFDEPGLSRLDLASGRRDIAPFDGEIESVVVGGGGTAWILARGGALWRWERDGRIRELALTEPPDEIMRLSGRVLARTARSLVVLDVEPVRAIPVEARALCAMASGYVAMRSSHGEVSVVDLESGGRIALPLSAVTSALVAYGDTVMFATDRGEDGRFRFQAIELAVPHDPAALRRWLRDVTNAVMTASGDGGGWPSS